MSREQTAAAVARRHAGALRRSAIVQRWARSMLAALDDTDDRITTAAAAIGLAIVVAVTGYAVESASLRQLLEELLEEHQP